VSTRTDRIEARVAPETADKIKQAAALSGTSTSAFVIDAAADRAERILHRQRETVVPSDYFDRLLDALDEPRRAIPALTKGFKRLRKIVAES
jgi:uncharacterized protein (DUF1778 family)